MTEAALVADLRSRGATERCFESIGEAIARLAREFPEAAARSPIIAA